MKTQASNNEKSALSQSLWIVVVADRGIIAHVHAYNNEADATKDLADYLRENHRYDGIADFIAIYQWLRQNDETLSAEIICQEDVADTNKS
jgi:hypothetical protein